MGRALTNVLVSFPNPLNTTTLGNFTELVRAGHAQLQMAPTEILVTLCESCIVKYNLKNEAKTTDVQFMQNQTISYSL
jgi:hypothetical protein